MEVIGSGPYWKCKGCESGLPIRLVGEADLLTLPAGEEVTCEVDGVSGSIRTGTRVRLTTHRFMWQTSGSQSDLEWFALRLDAFSSAAPLDRFMRSKRCLLHLRGGGSVSVKCTDAQRIDSLVSQLQQALTAGKWQEGSYDAAAIGGLQRILEHREARQQAVGDTLDVALADLNSLKQHAQKVADAARHVAAHAASAKSDQDSSVRRLLEDCGLVAVDGTSAVETVGGTGSAEVEADVVKVCEAVLVKRGGLGMLLAHDAFCLVNRARGTALVAPEEIMSALRRASTKGNKLRLRQVGTTGAIAISLASTTDADADAQLLRQCEEVGCLSAFTLAAKLALSASEAQYLLRDAESRAVLVRDDAPEGVYYYQNFFNDY